MRSLLSSARARRRRYALPVVAVTLISCTPLGAILLSSATTAGGRETGPSPVRPLGDGHARGARGAAEWTTVGAGDGSNYSSLDQITPDNVASLRVAWVYRTGDVSDGAGDTTGTGFQATPIMVEGTLYLPTPFSRVIALDAETGTERWTFDPRVNRSSRLRKFVASRGVATWVDPTRGVGERCRRRILLATVDARLIALDAATGIKCGDFGSDGEVDLRDGVRNLRRNVVDYRQSAPPTVVRDLVIVGSSITDNGRVESPSGVVRAFDARTGRVRWRWEPLVDIGDSTDSTRSRPVRAGAANAWGTLSVDAVRNLVFVPTSSASPDHFGGLRPGPNRHANSVVALEASTGRVVWSFQLVHHDLWDYDVGAQPGLAEVTRDGARVPVVVAASKSGHLFFLDRDSGAPFFPVEERSVPASDVPGEMASPTQPFPTKPRALAPQGLRPDDAWGLTSVDRRWCRARIRELRSDGVYAPPSVRGTVVFPGLLGGVNWGGVAVDNARGILITSTIRLAGVVTLIPKAAAAARQPPSSDLYSFGEQHGAPYSVRREILLSPIGLPCNAPPWGTLAAVDMASGEVRWEIPLGTMTDVASFAGAREWGSVVLGGPLMTAGGVVFIGASMDRRLRAFDVETGRLLWNAALPASAQATPMTYRATPGGRQYVVVAAGGHAAMRSALGDHVVAFALP